MAFLQRCTLSAALVGAGLVTANMAHAQITTINSDIVHNREFNDIPGATLTTVNNYPSVVSFDEQGVSKTGGFANRDVWRFSNDNGATAYHFNNNDFFQTSMTLNLSGTVSPRKEAGFLFTTPGGDGQFIVNTDRHEVVAFGGPLPFFAFPKTFNSGDTITLGMTYFLDSNGKRAVIYSANGVDSPAQEFTNNEQGIITGATLGGYLQAVNDPANPANFGTATFTNISIHPFAVPEPSALALGLSALPLGLFLRRRRAR